MVDKAGMDDGKAGSFDRGRARFLRGEQNEIQGMGCGRGDSRAGPKGKGTEQAGKGNVTGCLYAHMSGRRYSRADPAPNG